MGMFNAFHPNPHAGLAVAATTATQIPGVDATKPQRIRVSWSAAGYFALGADSTVNSATVTDRIYLPTAAGSEIFDVGSDQNWIHSSVALNIVVGS